MTLGITPSPELHRRREAAAAFLQWLQSSSPREHEPLRALIERSEVPISWSSAYRVACQIGLRGRRRNCSMYDKFWASINWRLPDSVLMEIWGTMHGNLRQRRLRMQAGPPRWRANRHAVDASYQRALAVERRKAARYRGPRPC